MSTEQKNIFMNINDYLKPLVHSHYSNICYTRHVLIWSTSKPGLHVIQKMITSSSKYASSVREYNFKYIY